MSGDIVELIAGDLVPADSRLLESRDLFISQALLTGELYPAEKHASDTPSGVENPAAASNAVFAGTSVISGTATIVVCRTGAKSALGHLAESLAEKPPATDFAAGTRRFGLLIMRLTMLMVIFVLVVNISFHRPVLESLMFALALAVGLTPELLPMIVTVTLARTSRSDRFDDATLGRCDPGAHRAAARERLWNAWKTRLPGLGLRAGPG